ncbi:MAG: hypothetical protein ACXVFV_10360, partial [Mycobacteriales bacterium]
KAGSTSWSRLGSGLPQVRIYDLDLDRTGRYLSVAAYGRGVWVLDLGAKATTSSTGPGTAKAAAAGAATSGRSLAATGADARLPWLAGAALRGALLLVRRRARG